MTKIFRDILHSETLLINDLSNKLRKDGKKVYRFGFGQCPFSPPKILQEELIKHVHRHEYAPVEGIPELREGVAQFHQNKLNITVHSEQILIGPGSKQLIFNALASFKKASVYLVTPSWVSYEPQATLLGHQIIRLYTSFENNWKLDLNDWELRLKNDKSTQKIIILNYPNNPTGLSINDGDLKEIAKLARKYNVFVIADEIYGFLNHSSRHLSLAEYYPEGTLITSGLSKWAGAGGWRLGIAILPDNFHPEFKKTLIGIGSETYSTTSVPIQCAAIKAYKDSEKMVKYNQKTRTVLKVIGTYCATQLKAFGVKVHQPEGGFYLYPDFSPFKNNLKKKGIFDSRSLCENLLDETGVALLPGFAFGDDPSQLHARLAYVDFKGDHLLETNNGLNETNILQLCPQMSEGMSQISKWLQAL